MLNKRNYIGTNFGHSSSSCLVNDEGRIIFAAEEGKLIGDKSTVSFPENGMSMIMQKIDARRETMFSEGWNKWQRLLYKGIGHTLKYLDDKAYYDMRLKKEIKRFYWGQRCYKKYGKFMHIGHHKAHSLSLLPAGLPPKSLILVSDTMGEKESMSIYYWDSKLYDIKKIPYPNSIGAVYHQFAYHLGFLGRTGPGKMMALSGYGIPKWRGNMDAITILTGCDLRIDRKYYPVHRLKDAPQKFANQLANNDLGKILLSENISFNDKADIASSVQSWFTNTTWDFIRNITQMVRSKLNLEVNHLGMVGGAALNCQCNGSILEKLSEINIDTLIVSPWSDDSGTAIGAAIGRFLIDNPNSPIPQATAFLGPPILSNSNTLYSKFDIDCAVQGILKGELISLASDGLEFGPRALGGRCIIASAFLNSSRDKLNRCKSRPWFMPFAPAILEEDFQLFFYGKASKNMTWTVKAKQIAKTIIPSAIHETGESRVQLVGSENKLLHGLLKGIKEVTGTGIVLLTSLNGSGETVPVTYNDAVNMSIKLGLYGMLSDVGWKRLQNN